MLPWRPNAAFAIQQVRVPADEQTSGLDIPSCDLHRTCNRPPVECSVTADPEQFTEHAPIDREQTDTLIRFSTGVEPQFANGHVSLRQLPTLGSESDTFGKGLDGSRSSLYCQSRQK